MDQHIVQYDGEVGGGVDRGGAPYQRANGLRRFLGDLFRLALPWLTRGARAIGKEALRCGLNILGDVVNSTPLKVAFTARFTESLTNLRRSAENTFESQGLFSV